MSETETKETVAEEKKETTEKKQEGIQIPELERELAVAVLNKMNGMVFKVDKLFFKVNYINPGKLRFSAELINDVKN